MRLPIVLSMVLAAVYYFSAAPAFAQHGNGHGHGNSEHGQENEGEGHSHGHARKGAAFATRERRMILDYFHDHPSSLPPGLAKRNGNLPPGLEKHLERDGTLPPGLQKRFTPLPYSLERELPPLPRDCDCTRGIVGFDVLILNRRTGRILDVISDILGR